MPLFEGRRLARTRHRASRDWPCGPAVSGITGPIKKPGETEFFIPPPGRLNVRALEQHPCGLATLQGDLPPALSHQPHHPREEDQVELRLLIREDIKHPGFGLDN